MDFYKGIAIGGNSRTKWLPGKGDGFKVLAGLHGVAARGVGLVGRSSVRSMGEKFMKVTIL